MRVLVTGSTGFVGRATVPLLLGRGLAVRSVSRSRMAPGGQDHDHVSADLERRSSLDQLVVGCDSVLHLLGLAHRPKASPSQERLRYEAVNVAITSRLAEAASRSGVRRFVFVSSIKVNGESTRGRAPFTADDTPDPKDAYGESKRDAEEVLRGISRSSGMEFVVVRPPLVYGPGVRANFESLVKAVAAQRVLPLASVRNSRSFVSLQSLTDLLATVLVDPRAANRTFLVSDDRDLSTPDLVRSIAAALGVAPRLVPCPVGVLRALSMSMGQVGAFERLCGTLRIDISATKSTLGWRPVMTVEQALAAMAASMQGASTA